MNDVGARVDLLLALGRMTEHSEYKGFLPVTLHTSRELEALSFFIERGYAVQSHTSHLPGEESLMVHYRLTNKGIDLYNRLEEGYRRFIAAFSDLS